MDYGTAVVRGTHLFDVVHRLANVVLLLVLFAVAVHIDAEQGRKCVHTAHTYPVQTARDFVGILVELTSCVQDRHYDLKRRLALFGVHGHRNSAAVVFNCNAVAFVNDYTHLGGMPRKGLVNGVVHDLIHKVV